MELENQEVVTEEAVETPEVQDVETPETEEGLEVSSEQVPKELEASEYTPDFTYRFKGEEKEFDDILKEKIKSKEEEDYFRDLITKRTGFDEVKASRDALTEELKEISHYKDNYEKMMNNLSEIDSMIEKKDLDRLFQVLGLSEEDVINHSYEKVRYRELTPEQQRVYNQQRERENSIYDLEQQNQDYQKQINQIQQQIEFQNIEARKAELNNILSSEGIASAVRSFDEKHGQGVFFQEVAKRGALHYQMTGKDVSPKELVDEVISLYGLSTQPSIQQPQQREKPKVIPNVGTSSATPVKRSPKGLDDLKALIGKG